MLTGASPSKDLCSQTGTRECVIFQQANQLQKEAAWSHRAMPELDDLVPESITAGVPSGCRAYKSLNWKQNQNSHNH